jgi:hypothetical protein
MKTLVVHPDDRSTDFLKQIYEGRDFTVFNGHQKDISKSDFHDLVKEHDRIIMMGHGFPGGLFMSHINSSIVYLLREKECVCIWCNADQFVNQYKLKGFYTGMFISEVGEAKYFRIKTDQPTIDFSNELFTKLVTENIDNPNIHSVLKESYVGDDPVIQFNNDRLYYRDLNDEMDDLLNDHYMDMIKTDDDDLERSI